MTEKHEEVISRMKMSKSTGSRQESTKGEESPLRGRDESQVAAEGEVRRYLGKSQGLCYKFSERKGV